VQRRKKESREIMFRRRVRRLRRFLSREKADAILVTDLMNIAYLCGFNGSYAMLLVTPRDTLFFTDFRYI
jgi:Xaa-Pro aminopeptidase